MSGFIKAKIQSQKEDVKGNGFFFFNQFHQK